jgi:hypothetical protein
MPPVGEGSEPLEWARGQADRLPALKYRFNDVRGEEGQRQGPTDLAGVPMVPPSEVFTEARADSREPNGAG